MLQPVRPSVCPAPPMFSKEESHRNFKISNLVETQRWTRVTQRNKYEDERLQVTANENVKIVFRAYLHQKQINLRQKIILISGPFYTIISSNAFYHRKCFVFVIFFCNYPGVPHVAAATCRSPTCLTKICTNQKICCGVMVKNQLQYGIGQPSHIIKNVFIFATVVRRTIQRWNVDRQNKTSSNNL